MKSGGQHLLQLKCSSRRHGDSFHYALAKEKEEDGANEGVILWEFLAVEMKQNPRKTDPSSSRLINTNCRAERAAAI